jgi:hypothetical protein
VWAPVLQVKTALLVAGLGAMGADPSDGKKVLLIVNEPNEKVYLSGRNIPTLAINTSHAVQVRGSCGMVVGWLAGLGVSGGCDGTCSLCSPVWRRWWQRALLVLLAHQTPARSPPHLRPLPPLPAPLRCTMC